MHRNRVKAGEAAGEASETKTGKAGKASEGKNRGKGGRKLSFQRGMQLLSAALLNGYAVGFAKGRIFTGKSKAVCVPVLNCYSCPGAFGACPIGSLQAVLCGKRHFPFYVLGTLMLFGIVLGRLVCGLLCPFGLVQDLLHKIPVPKITVPKKVDRPARYLKYVVLAVLVFLLPAFAVTKSGVNSPYFCKYLCPAGTLGGGIPQMAANAQLRELAGILFHWKLLVLILILAASVAIHRPFCRYLCPLGAFYAVFNRFSFYQMHLDKSKCVDCKACERSCPMAVEVTKQVNGPECIRCGKCKSVCPTGAISSGFIQKMEKGSVSAGENTKPGGAKELTNKSGLIIIGKRAKKT
ncbi:MAG: 4Fe-4S binding protein [Lachnospiraceae bacterium]|nr:4Fe-4S binding protein [Lachnospiraceae bacterium]